MRTYAILMLWWAATVAAADFYVSPTGQDTNLGSLEKPFATISRARDEVRKLVATGLKANIVVWIHGGIYELHEPLVFDPRDSGTDEYSVTYAVVPGETALISGGKRITEWKTEANGLWTTEIPEALSHGGSIRHLFVNGRRAIRARKPNADAKEPFLRILDAKLDDTLQTWEIKFAPGDLANWKNPSEMELIVLTEWDMFRKRIQKIDSTRGVLTLLPPHIKPHRSEYFPSAGKACYLENARAFLDEPGEWFWNRSGGELTYWPRLGETVDTVEAWVSRLTNLVTVHGGTSRLVRNLHFNGLSFAYTTWSLPDAGYMGNCVNGRKPAAIEMTGCDNCSLVNCQISKIGGDGIRVEHPNLRFLIEGNSIHDVSGHGIVLSGDGPIAPPNLGGTIVNNHVYDCGIEYHGCYGINALTFTSGLRISHNVVHDVPYIGIAFGIRESNPSLCKSNEVSANRVYNAMKLLSDGGGIYEIGTQGNSLIKGNYITDVLRSSAACGAPNNGIFMDDHGGGCTILDNVVMKTSGTPLRFNCDPTKHITAINYFGENAFYKGRAGGYARAFTNDRFMEIPHSPALDPQRLTVDLWIKPLAFAGGNDPSYWLVSKNGSELTDGHYSLLMSHNNVGAYLNIGGGRENVYSAWSHDNPIRSNEWSHVAMTYDGQRLSVYCNGKLVGRTEVSSQKSEDSNQKSENSDQPSAVSGQTSDLRPLTSGTPSQPTSDLRPLTSGPSAGRRSPGTGALYLGKRSDGNNSSFNGLMDDVRIYSRALSAEEIAAETIDYGREKTIDARPQTQVSSLKSNVSSLTSNLVLHLDFTAMHDRMEKIIAEAGPEEPYRSRFREQKSAISGQPTASSLKSGEDRSQKPEIKDQKTETGEEKKNAD